MPATQAPGHLPLIDLTGSWDSSAGAQRVATALDQACRTHGFFYLAGHRVPPGLQDAILDANQRFFALRDDLKARWHIDRSKGLRRGWDPIGWQALEAGRPADLKESFYLGVDRGPQDPLVQAHTPNHGPNTWPDEHLAPGFRATCEAYAQAMTQLARHLMGLMALALGLPRSHFEPCMCDPMPVLRLLHYPPHAQRQDEAQVGSGAHTDWGALTLLLQDGSGGLQVMGRDGNWFDALPQPGTFIVNLGDLMQRWTHDRYRSTLHRVINDRSGRARHSVAWFWEVDYHARIETLPGCLPDNGTPSRYPPISAGEHIIEMYRRSTLRDRA